MASRSSTSRRRCRTSRTDPVTDPGSVGGHLRVRPQDAAVEAAGDDGPRVRGCARRRHGGRGATERSLRHVRACASSGREHLCPESEPPHARRLQRWRARRRGDRRPQLPGDARAGVGPDVGALDRTDLGRAARGPSSRAARRRPARPRPRRSAAAASASRVVTIARHHGADVDLVARHPGAARGGRAARRRVVARRRVRRRHRVRGQPVGARRRDPPRAARAARSSSRPAGSIRWRSARRC